MSELRKLSHSHDPATSPKAVRDLNDSGGRAIHAKIVYDMVEAHPFSTAPEIQKHTGLDEYQVRRRLTDLKNQGKVQRGQTRTCSIKGSSMTTWTSVLASKQRSLFD